MRKTFVVLFIIISFNGFGQTKIDSLTVDLIMRDPKWIGTSPSSPYWSRDGKFLFFSWNPENKTSDSIYYITTANLTPQKASNEMQKRNVAANAVAYNNDSTAYTYSRDGDIYFGEVKTNKERRITQTIDPEFSPSFIMNGSMVAFNRNQNLFAWDVNSGATIQLTNFQRRSAPPKEILADQERWLKEDQLKTFEVLRSRKTKKDSAEAAAKAIKEKELRAIYIDDKNNESG